MKTNVFHFLATDNNEIEKSPSNKDERRLSFKDEITQVASNFANKSRIKQYQCDGKMRDDSVASAADICDNLFNLKVQQTLSHLQNICMSN